MKTLDNKSPSVIREFFSEPINVFGSAFVAAILLAILAFAAKIERDRTDGATLIEATIIRADKDTTTIELTNGQRLIVGGNYGAADDHIKIKKDTAFSIIRCD